MTQTNSQRQVKYRGLTYKGVWVYGLPTFLIQEDCDENIIDGIRVSWEENVDIKPETLSEFTGLQDKNGKDIYEGDIVNVFTSTRLYRVARVWYDINNAMWRLEAVTRKKLMDLEYLGHVINADGRTIEVIGNIHEDPGLLQSS